MTDLDFPSDLLYLAEHDVWARLGTDGTARVGISALGIKLSGEIYMCRAKPLGSSIDQGRAVAVVELAKAIVSVKSAVGGEVIELNPALDDRPELVHRDPYGQGWVARLRLTDFARDRPALVDSGGMQARMAARLERR